MSIVNRVPKGWLGLLDAKTQGQTPKDPIQQLAPVMDLTPNYLADIPLETTAALESASAADIGTNIAIVTVPPGELWYVYGVSGEAVAPSSTLKLVFGVVLVAASGLGNHWIAEPQINNVSVTGVDLPYLQFESYVVAEWFTTPFLASAGSAFAIRQTRLWSTTSVATTSVAHRTVKV